MTAIAILSPGHPHVPGGVTDHTSRLVRHWSEAGHAVLVASTPDDPPEDLVEEWAANGVAAALIQYVPFLYGRRGLSRYPERIAAASRKTGIRVAVFVHEPWVPLTRPQWLVLGPLQRLQLHRLIRRVDGAATAVPAWQSLVSPRPELIYVGSTSPPAPLPHGRGESTSPLAPLPTSPLSPLPKGSGEPADQLLAPVVFSPFAAGLNWEWIVRAVRAIGAPDGLVILGATEAQARRHPIGRWMEPGWDWRGRLSSAEIVPLLARARLVLAPFVDGVTGRRTSVCAALSTGARTLTSTGHLFDPFFRDGLDVATTETEFAERATALWTAADSPAERTRRLEWYGRFLDPRVLDARLLRLVTGSGDAT